MDTSNLTPLAQANYQTIQRGAPVFNAFKEMAKDPMKQQEEFLLKLLDDNKDTEYGKKYGFAEITSIKEYQEKIPVTTYDDYAAYIERMTEKGETNLITAYPVNHYNKTSGTLGTPKRIPSSDPASMRFFKYVNSYAGGLLEDQLGTGWIHGKRMSTVESGDTVVYLPCGASYGALSVKSMLDIRPFLSVTSTSPDEAVFPQIGTNTRYLHARFALMEDNVMQLLTSFASFLYELMRYIEHNWEMLVDDIENGTIHESVSISPNVRESLMQKIKPMPERAAQLRAIFEQGFDKPFATKVWPKLALVMAVGTGAFKAYIHNLRTRYVGEEIPCFYIGLGASEGVFSVPVKLNSTESALIPDSMFYEFLPIEAENDFSQLVTMDKLEQGRVYEVFTTNLSGFYRYRMRDAIRIVGMYEATPTMEYLYRLDNTTSLMGEKTSEEAVRFAAEETAKELGLELAGFSMYPDPNYSPVRYQYFFEIAHMPKDINPKVIRLCLEKNLAKANPSMGEKVKKGICGATRLNFLEPESYNLYVDMLTFKGVASAQIKPVTVIRNEVQRKFFFGQTEYSCELMR